MNKKDVIDRWTSSFHHWIKRLDYLEYEGEDLVILDNLGNMKNDFFELFAQQSDIPKKELNILIEDFKKSGNA